MSYEDLYAQMLRSLHRARALDDVEIVRDLYDTEVDEAARCLRFLIVHRDHVTGTVPTEVISEINRRYDEVFPRAVAS